MRVSSGAPVRHELLLLDLDGTISDPLAGFARSINFALSHFGYPTLEESAFSSWIGPPLEQTLAAITGVSSPVHVGELAAKYRERYGDIGYAENTLYPGMAEVLAMLHDAGVALAVCTAKRKDFAERILAMFGLRNRFRFVDGGEPGVQKWQQVAALLAHGAIPASSVMIGDRSVDMIAGHRNGLLSAGVLWGHGSREELEAERADYLFSSPADLVLLAPVGVAPTADEDGDRQQS